MADLNARIAQGAQFKAPPDPFAQFAQMQQMQQGQQANQLNQMKMQEYQRGMEETNALRRLDPSSPTYLNEVMKISPEKGFAFGKLKQEAKTAGTEGQIKDTKLIADKLALLPDAYRMADTPEAYFQLHNSVHSDPVLGPWLNSMGATSEKGIATLQEALQTGKFGELHMKSMQSVSQLLDSMKPLTVAAGSSVYNPQAGTFTQAPRADQLKTPAELAQAIQLAQASRAPGATVILPAQEKAFEAELGKGQSQKILASKTAAEDAAQILQTNDVGRSLLKSGAITGTGANFFVGLNNALKQGGVDFGYADAAANSQAYGAAMAANTGKLIKQFGAGTGISDADRAYATKAAAGEISMTENAIRKVLDINDRAARSIIQRHNQSVKGIKTNIPLDVEVPTSGAPSQPAENAIPTSRSAPPKPAARTVTRTGTLGGRQVIQYSDGSVEYAN